MSEGQMICANCGFQNAAGDQFCGSCGQPLGAAAAPAPGLTTPAQPAPPPTTPAQPAPPPATPAQPAPPPANPPDVICWKCGRRNPPGRSFCMQCGERLEVAGATGAAAGGTTAARPGGVSAAPGSGGDGGMFAGRGRVLGIGAVLVALVLLGALAAAAALNLPGQHPVAALVESPSPSPLASSVAGPTSTPILASVVPGGTSPTPSATATAEPTAGNTPTPTPKPTAKPTPVPTPITCANYAGPTKTLVLHPGDQHTIPAKKDWCVVSVTFTNDSPVGEPGTFKLYLMNSAVFTDLNNYTYGWLEADLVTDFQDSKTYQPKVTYPKSYMKGSLYDSTVISFLVPYCAGTTCVGSIQIDYNPIPAQPH